MSSSAPSALPAQAQARSSARLAAVQALYQQDMEGVALDALLSEFHEHRLGKVIDETLFAAAEEDFFDDLVRGVDAQRQRIDALLTARLKDGWSLRRLDKTMLQILRCGAYELLARGDVPTGAAINEYVEVAKAFFEEREAKFVNGILDSLAEETRA